MVALRLSETNGALKVCERYDLSLLPGGMAVKLLNMQGQKLGVSAYAVCVLRSIDRE